MIYVALLRGINVGGNNKIEMPKLKLVFEKLGFKDVLTYINSGNVIFEDEKNFSNLQIVEMIEKGIKANFDLNIKVVIRDLEQIERICGGIPNAWLNNSTYKTDVLFLWEEIDKVDVIDKIEINSDVDNVKYISGALVWHVEKKDYGKSMMNKFISNALYKKMTARNINTTRKLLQMMKAEKI